MQIEELKFKPLSDIGANDKEIVGTHATFIEEGKYTDATNYLDNENYDKGARASFFNELSERINVLGTNILNNEYTIDETYSSSKPVDTEQKTWWLQEKSDVHYYNASNNDSGNFTNYEGFFVSEIGITLASYTNGIRLTNGKYSNGANTKRFKDAYANIRLQVDLSEIRKLEIDAYMWANYNFKIEINNIEVLNYKNGSEDCYSEIIANIGKYNFNGVCTISITGGEQTNGLSIFGIIGMTM